MSMDWTWSSKPVIMSSMSSPDTLSSSMTISCCSFLRPNATGTSLWSPQMRPSFSMACSMAASSFRSVVSSHGLMSIRIDDLAMTTFFSFFFSSSFFFLASRAALSSSVSSPNRSTSSSSAAGLGSSFLGASFLGSSFLAGAAAAAAGAAGTNGVVVGAVTFTAAPNALRSASVNDARFFTQRNTLLLPAPSRSLNAFTSSSDGLAPPRNSLPFSLPSSSPAFFSTSAFDISRLFEEFIQ
mmetsp:Transcript_21914/g.39969  ORF Transcript_21914/g.39969 Transcript_21914/m.39969 type:complete len:240 (+) Transcript_21914:230-949(+)